MKIITEGIEHVRIGGGIVLCPAATGQAPVIGRGVNARCGHCGTNVATAPKEEAK